MSDDVEQGAKVDAHAGAVRAGEMGHGSGTLRVGELDGWFPIETAPRDGTLIEARHGVWLPVTMFWEHGRWQAVEYEFPPNPTHWRPKAS